MASLGAVGTAALGRLVGLFLPSGFALRRYWLFLVACVFTMLSCSRIAALVDNFSAPFSVYRDLHARLMEPHPPFQSLRTDSRVLVCVGKEWYRFPSSFYFPADREDQHVRLAFLKSDFTGQLPRLYEETPNGTSVIPPNMNDENKEEPSRYVAEGDCDYIVDLVLPGQREPDYRAMPHWKVPCHVVEFIRVPGLFNCRNWQSTRSWTQTGPHLWLELCIFQECQENKTHMRPMCFWRTLGQAADHTLSDKSKLSA